MLVVANPAEAAAILGAMRVIADAHGAGTLSQAVSERMDMTPVRILSGTRIRRGTRS